jgi:hypothetical protein
VGAVALDVFEGGFAMEQRRLFGVVHPTLDGEVDLAVWFRADSKGM